MTSKIPTSGFTFRLVSQEDTNSYYSSSETMLGQLTEVMSMDDVQVLYPKERITLYGINSNFDWTSVRHSLRCGSLGLERSTPNSFVDAIEGLPTLPSTTRRYGLSTD